jgi:hypothetical protein
VHRSSDAWREKGIEIRPKRESGSGDKDADVTDKELSTLSINYESESKDHSGVVLPNIISLLA